MALKIFGFSFGSEVKPNLDTPIKPSNLDSTTDISATIGGYISPSYGVIDIDNLAQSENEQITQYRNIAKVPEVARAIEEIASEAIITDKNMSPININLDETPLPPNIQKIIVDEHKEAMRLLSFNTRGHDIFKRWYVDGRISYQALIDPGVPANGIQELRFIDPRKIKRVRELIKVPDALSRTEIIKGVREYYLFSDKGIGDIRTATDAVQMTRESIVHCNSGLHDPNTNIVQSYLSEALRPANNLRMMEDSMIIYRLTRSVERRVFKVYTGDLPKAKAEQYVQEVANKHRQKSVFDVNTGEVKNDKRYMAMTEDFWLPVGENSSGTDITTLPGGENVGETGEADYFKQKLYESLYVPSSRMTNEQSMFSSGTEVTRDEVRFSRFINRIRKRFSGLLIEIIQRNCVLKGIMTEEEFESIRDLIFFDFVEDNYFAEAMEYNIILQRMAVLSEVDAFVGKYVSKEYVFKKILMLTDEERDEMLGQIQMDNQQMLQQEILEQKARIKAGIEPPPMM